MNVPQLAALTGLSPAYLYRRVNGETALDIDDLERLAAALSVPVLQLFPARELAERITGGYSATPGSDHPFGAEIGQAA
jgi:transcriptional regulator with XRE-family HTH domain